MVAVHFHFRREPDHPGYAIIDILRIERGYIREHWDVMQEVPDPANCRNDNGMF
jgi:predicted SnoaL-like aldol condensation-catalyzing enzyme